MQDAEWQHLIGSTPEEFAHRLVDEQPTWVTGSLSHWDARFLFVRALNARASAVVEIGTGSGFSTAVLCHALHFAAEAGLIGADYRIMSYDISKRWYIDNRRLVGDVAREMLPATLLDHVEFRAPGVAADVRDHHARDSIGFVFIDGLHAHPWPTLDMLAILDSLAPGAEVVLHDVNLPVRHAAFPHWGAKYLFDAVDSEKHLSYDPDVPNIGCFSVPNDKAQLRRQLLALLETKPWDDEEVPEAALARALARAG